jgi:hypothetical protein
MYHDKLLKEISRTKFLGLELDKNVNWKNHIQNFLPRLSSDLIRRMSPFCNLTTLKMIYFAYFHLIIEIGIIFWGISVESKKVLVQQKRIIRAMKRFNLRTPCRNLFRKLDILILPSQFIYSTIKFLSSSLDQFIFNSSVYNNNTTLRVKLHKSTAKLKMCQRSTYNNCRNIYNKLPDDLAYLITKKKQFLLEFKKYLIAKPYYSLEEFLNKEQI